MGAVESLCRRAILLRGGKLVNEGPVALVIREYLRSRD
jgi:ABC-type polysaccharide/polyol phosphate transport system ATPase subunit